MSGKKRDSLIFVVYVKRLLTCVAADFLEFVVEIGALLRIWFSLYIFKELRYVLNLLLVFFNGVGNEGVAIIAILASTLIIIGISVAFIAGPTIEIRAAVALAAVGAALSVD